MAILVGRDMHNHLNALQKLALSVTVMAASNTFAGRLTYFCKNSQVTAMVSSVATAASQVAADVHFTRMLAPKMQWYSISLANSF